MVTWMYREGINSFVRGLSRFLTNLTTSHFYAILEPKLGYYNLLNAHIRVVSNDLYHTRVYLEGGSGISTVPDKEISESLSKELGRPVDPKVASDIKKHAVEVAKEASNTAQIFGTITSGARLYPISSTASDVVKREGMRQSTTDVKTAFKDSPPPARALIHNSPAEYVRVSVGEVREVRNVAEAINSAINRGRDTVTVEVAVPTPEVIPVVTPPPTPPRIVDMKTRREVRVSFTREVMEVPVKNFNRAIRGLNENINAHQKAMQRFLREATRVVPVTLDVAKDITNSLKEYSENVSRIKTLAGEEPKKFVPIVINTIYGPEYICPICGATYYSMSALREHMKLHGVELLV